MTEFTAFFTAVTTLLTMPGLAGTSAWHWSFESCIPWGQAQFPEAVYWPPLGGLQVAPTVCPPPDVLENWHSLLTSVDPAGQAQDPSLP
jgi:hypothetical protein